MFDFETAKAHYLRFAKSYRCICAIDTESTGLATRHGDEGFMVSATYSDGRNVIWTARVDPFTRKPTWTDEDRAALLDLVSQPDVLYVMTNKKFDTRILKLILGSEWDDEDFLCRCHETIGIHHGLNNRDSHALKDAAVKYGEISDEDESELHQATREAAKIARHLGWKLASKETCHIRKAPNKGWAVMDMWLCRELAYHLWEESEAGKWVKEYCRVFKPGITANNRLEACFGNRPDLLVPRQPSTDEIRRLRKMDGWEWHPPEISAIGVHKWYTLCAKYCSIDTLRSLVLYNAFSKASQEAGLWDVYLESQINCLMTYRIENNGVSMNKATALRQWQQYVEEKEEAQQAVSYSMSKVFPINANSPDQIRHVLYEKFGLHPTRFTRNKKNRDSVGKPTVDQNYLGDLIGMFKPESPEELYPPKKYGGAITSGEYFKQLRKWHDRVSVDEPTQLFSFCCSVLRFKKASTAMNQIDNFIFNLTGLDTETMYGTLYPNINPYGTDTTRQSSNNPNAQNLSKGGKQRKVLEFLFRTKRSLRNLLGPRPGREWWSVDYTQLQLVIFAVLSGDDKLLYALQHGLDLHDNMARIIFGLPTDINDPNYLLLKPTDIQRVVAKGANFGFTFGAQEARLREITGMSGLYELLLNKLPGVQEFLAKKEWEVRTRGYVFTKGGYRLFVPEETPYAGSVYAVQGTEGEIVKRATYGVEYYLDRNVDKSKFYTTLPVHDELNYDSERGYGERYIGSVCDIMEDAAKSFGVPAKVECKYSITNYGEGVKYEFDEPVTEQAI